VTPLTPLRRKPDFVLLRPGQLLSIARAQATVLVFTVVCTVLAVWATLDVSIRRVPSLADRATA
jgi:hypothetical protein